MMKTILALSRIKGGTRLRGCDSANMLAERLNEMRTQFVQCGQCPQMVRAMSPSAGNVPKWCGQCPQVRG